MKTKKQLTAVEWFAKQVLESRQLGFISNKKFDELLKEGNKMFEKQIMQTWFESKTNYFQEFEQYYNETFKSE
jgi:hypothetical protein